MRVESSRIIRVFRWASFLSVGRVSAITVKAGMRSGIKRPGLSRLFDLFVDNFFKQVERGFLVR